MGDRRSEVRVRYAIPHILDHLLLRLTLVTSEQVEAFVPASKKVRGKFIRALNNYAHATLRKNKNTPLVSLLARHTPYPGEIKQAPTTEPR